MENFNLDDYDLKNYKRGDIVEGKVISIQNDNTLVISIPGSAIDGIIHLDHYTNDKSIESFKDIVKVGDTIKATVTKITEDEFLLSRLNQIDDEVLDKLNQIKDANETLTVNVVEEIEGKGYRCEYNSIRLFMPRSQATKNVTVKSKIDVKIIDSDPKKHSYIVSRKAIEDEEFKEERQKELDKVNVGDVLKGTVIKIEPYGALLKFETLTGLLKANQVSHSFVDITKELTLGQELEVKVIKKENNKIELSRKALLETPFKLYIKDHKVSDKVEGIVKNKLQYGLLLELAPEVKGLLHQSEFSHNPNDNFQNCVKINDKVEVVIININEDKERISLSRKPLLDNPWERVDAKVGDVVDIKISEINEKGLKVEALGVDGFVPMSEALTEKGNLTDFYAVGDTSKAIIVEIKPREWRLKLSIKKLKDEEERKSFEKHLTDKEESVTIGDAFKDVLEESK